MNLVIDVGNTLVKLGVFDLGILQVTKGFDKKDFIQMLTNVSNSYPEIEHVLVASVGNLTEEQLAELDQCYSVLYLDQNTKIPFSNKYGTPETLGVDRIAVISAAAQQYPGKNVLVIDVEIGRA